MAILFNDTALLAQKNKKKLIAAFSRVIDRGVFLRGAENKQLQTHLESRFRKHVVLTASGHDALLLTIQSLGLTAADEVIVPANAYPTAFPIALSGANVVLADVDYNGQMTINTIQKSLTTHTKAVVLVHLYGLVGDLTSILRFCRKHHLILIEDCAQSFGTTFDKKPVGTYGDAGCFSFYPTKNIGSLGEGGAIVTTSKKLAQNLQERTLYGERVHYHGTFLSGHSNMPELQSAGLRVYLAQSKTYFAAKKRIEKLYRKLLAPLAPNILPLESHPKSNPVVHVFVIRAKKRNALQTYLAKRGIPTLIHYPVSVNRVRAFAHFKFAKQSFPIAEQLATEILSLPFHPYMTNRDVASVVHSIQRFYART